MTPIQNLMLQQVQLDFLRLFELCKRLNIITRRRKTPTTIVRDYIQKNGYISNKAMDKCSDRLFDNFITKLFEKENLKKTWLGYTYTLPMSPALKQKYNHLIFIQNNNIVSCIANTNNIYPDAIRAHIHQPYGIEINLVAFNKYELALKCIKLKAYLGFIFYPTIKESYDSYIEEEERKKQPLIPEPKKQISTAQENFNKALLKYLSNKTNNDEDDDPYEE